MPLSREEVATAALGLLVRDQENSVGQIHREGPVRDLPAEGGAQVAVDVREGEGAARGRGPQLDGQV